MVKKRRISKDLIIFLILTPVFLFCAFYLSSRFDNKQPQYSVVNKTKTGSSIFFEAMKELKYPVERTLKQISSQDTSSLQIVADKGDFNPTDSEVMAWIKQGGTLLYLTPGGYDVINLGTPEKQGSLKMYKYGKGKILIGNANNITNKALTESTQSAYEILKAFEIKPDGKIYFNENHLYAVSSSPGLWKAMPLGIKFAVYQLILVVAAFLFYKGKRFGKIVPLYEEVERSENEYVYSAASLYKMAKCWDIMLENYYKSFLRQMRSTHEDWITQWEDEALPNLNKAKKVYEFMHRMKERSGIKNKEYAQMVTAIEQLTNVIKKRRDSYWKTLKREQ